MLVRRNICDIIQILSLNAQEAKAKQKKYFLVETLYEIFACALFVLARSCYLEKVSQAPLKGFFPNPKTCQFKTLNSLGVSFVTFYINVVLFCSLEIILRKLSPSKWNFQFRKHEKSTFFNLITFELTELYSGLLQLLCRQREIRRRKITKAFSEMFLSIETLNDKYVNASFHPQQDYN